MKGNFFSRKKRQFRNLAKRVNYLICSGEWENLTAESRNSFILKLNTLYRQLSFYFSKSELKKILAAAAILIGLPFVSQSQSFAPPVQNPFGLTISDSVYISSPAFADIDHDEDLDLFSGNSSGYECSIQFFENTGTKSVPHFASPQENPFGIIPPPLSPVAFPAFADIDHDGDLDLFIGESSGEYHGNFQFYENTGSDTAPAFASPQANPFGLEPAYLFAIPVFTDIDNDGDLDLFSGGYSGAMNFYENIGVDTLADFAAPVQNPFGIISVDVIASPAFSDIDHDGDLDLFVGDYNANLNYFENTGTDSNPAFAVPLTNPFGLVPTYVYNFPVFADLDDDGDDDLLVGEYYGNFQYFKNTEINIGVPENLQDVIFELYPNPATDRVFVDLKDENPNDFQKVILTDLGGRVVKTAIVNSQNLRLKTDDLSPGIYLVKLVKDDKVYTRKLVITD